jgi:hypothetical protein
MLFIPSKVFEFDLDNDPWKNISDELDRRTNSLSFARREFHKGRAIAGCGATLAWAWL